MDGDIRDYDMDESGNMKISGFLHLDENEYEPCERDGEKGFWNEEKQLFLPNNELEEIAKSLIGAPILASTSQIEMIDEYFEKQYEKFNEYFNDNDNYDFSTDDYLLRIYDDSKVPLIFFSIDMVESTKRSIKLDLKTNSTLNNMFLNESALLIRGFGGHPYKFQGDGLIAFFTTQNILNNADNSIQCSYNLKIFIEQYLNKFLEEKNIDLIEFRISINYGEVFVKDLGEKVELTGYNINATFKIQDFADKNDIVIGSNLVDLVHKRWRNRMKKLKINQRKLKKSGLHEDMKIYKLHNLENRYER